LRSGLLLAQWMRMGRYETHEVPHNIPVCPLVVNDRIYFATERKAKKIHNIEANSRVTVVFDEYTQAWDYLRGVMVRRIVKTAEFRRLRKGIYDKYSQYEAKAALGDGIQ
jgi:hypothetical protein